MKTVLLDKSKHDRARFNCGTEPLNNYLKVMANQQARNDNTRTFVLEDESEPSYIIGFYTLTMVAIDLEALPKKLRNKHRLSTSGGLIARLAVDRRYKGNGFGEWLLVDALKKLLTASETVGFPFIIVDAKEGAEQFYINYGFTPFHDSANKLFITVADVRVGFTSAGDHP